MKKRTKATAADVKCGNGSDLEARVGELERCVARLGVMPHNARELHMDRVAAAAQAEREREQARYKAAQSGRRSLFDEWVRSRLVFHDDLVVPVAALVHDYVGWAAQHPRPCRMTPEQVEEEVQVFGVVKKTTMPSKMGGLTRIPSLLGVRLLDPGETAEHVVEAIEDATERAHRASEERHAAHKSVSDLQDGAIRARAATDAGLRKLAAQT